MYHYPYHLGPESEQLNGQRDRAFALALYTQLYEYAITAERELKNEGTIPDIKGITERVKQYLRHDTKNQSLIDPRKLTDYHYANGIAQRIVTFAAMGGFILSE